MDERQIFRLHFSDKVSQLEVELTKKLTHALTENNLRRIEKYGEEVTSKKIAKSKSTKKDYLYVCITGLPALVDEFEGLQIPGQKIVVYPECFTPGITQAQARQRLEFAQIEQQAYSLHMKLKNRTDKPLVFIFHSFGTTIVSALLRLYYSEYLSRVKGMIPMGAYTIRPDLYFGQYVEYAQSMTKQYMLENADYLFDMHKQAFQIMGLTTNHGSKYGNLASLYAFGKGLGFREMFSFIRQWPPVLKCFIYGRNDNRLAEDNLNETAIYYCHKRKFDEQYEKKAIAIMKQKYNINVDNIQQRFIYNLEKGKHSIHVQKRHKQNVIKIIKEYLDIIQQL